MLLEETNLMLIHPLQCIDVVVNNALGVNSEITLRTVIVRGWVDMDIYKASIIFYKNFKM